MVDMKGFRRGLKAAVDGPSIKDVRWNRHDFNVKKVRITKTADGLIIDGEDGRHISHRKRLRPDDQLYYKAEIRKDGSVKSLDINIKSTADILKEWFETAGKISAAVIAILGGAKKLKADGNADPFAEAEPTPGSLELLDGNWEGDAEMMIANIIAYAVAEHMPQVGKKPETAVPRQPGQIINPFIVPTELTRFRTFRDRLEDV